MESECCRVIMIILCGTWYGRTVGVRFQQCRWRVRRERSFSALRVDDVYRSMEWDDDGTTAGRTVSRTNCSVKVVLNNKQQARD